MSNTTNAPFIMVPVSIAFDTSLSNAARSLWAALEHRCGGHLTCWASYADLAAMVGCSARWIPEAAKKLVEAGLLIVEFRKGKTNRYTLLKRIPRKPVPTPEVSVLVERKSNNYEQKQPTKTNKKGGSTPFKGPINFDKYQPGGKYGKLTAPIGS